MSVFLRAAAALAIMVAPTVASAQNLPQLQGASLRAKVMRDDAGFLRYEYRVSVSTAEPLALQEFRVDVSSDTSRSDVGLDGLPAASNRALPPTKPRTGTVGTAVALVITSIPEEWSGVVDPDLRLNLGAHLDTAKIQAGGQAAGFEVSSHALPGIREARMKPDLWDLLPDLDVDPDAGATYEQLPASDQVVKTVGPVAPPAEFAPRSFADEIQAALDEARLQGWVANDEAKSILQGSMSLLKSALDEGDFDGARSQAAEFIGQVTTMGCTAFQCGPEQLLSSEAYALLRFNMEYLRERIPTTLQTGPVESDEVMNGIITDVIFEGEGRIGDQEGTAAAELALGQDVTTATKTAQFAWPNGVSVPVTLSFDGQTARLDAGEGGRIISFKSPVVPLPVEPENIFVRAQSTIEGAAIAVEGLSLNGEAIAENVVASGIEGVGILRIQASELEEGFVLTGSARFQWTGVQPTGSELSFQLKAVAVAQPN